MKKDDLLALTTGVADLLLGSAQLPPLATVGTLTIKNIYTYVSTLKENSFLRKLEIFFKETHKTSDADRIDFLRRLGDNQKEFWDKTLLIIERLDDELKTKMVGKLCEALILKHISIDQYHRASLIVENSYVSDLAFFHTIFEERMTMTVKYEETVKDQMPENNLVVAGLMIAGSGIHGHTPTEMGALIFQYALNDVFKSS